MTTKIRGGGPGAASRPPGEEALRRLTDLPPDAVVHMPAELARLLLLAHRWGLTKAERTKLDAMLVRLEGEPL